MKTLIVALTLGLATPALADTNYYVDFARTSNGNGTEASPWKARGNIVWATVTTALASGNVTIYFSSRATWNDNQELTIASSTNTTTNTLTLDGQSKYNLTASGSAVWADEDVTTNKAIFTNAGGTGGTLYIRSTNQHITIRGFSFLNPTWGGVNGGPVNPTTDVHDILIENNVVDSPVNNHGIWFGYAEADCYNLTVRNNTISNTPLEGIYIGHFDYLDDTITGVVIEDNTLINTGLTGEGDIDIKPGAAGAIVRRNTVYGTGGEGDVLAGVVVYATGVQVYNNTFHTLTPHNPSDGGNGIMINADGDGVTGKTLDGILVYNNLIYGNERHGITIFATKAASTITDLKILNNTIVGNSQVGFKTAASGGGSITIAEFRNNIIASSGSYAMQIVTGTTLTAIDHNLYDGSGTLFTYQGTERSWSQWQALDFDANGLNADPLLDALYRPTSSSPGVNAGSTQSEFTTDKNEVFRQTWDIGAYEFGSTVGSGLARGRFRR